MKYFVNFYCVMMIVTALAITSFGQPKDNPKKDVMIAIGFSAAWPVTMLIIVDELNNETD